MFNCSELITRPNTLRHESCKPKLVLSNFKRAPRCCAIQMPKVSCVGRLLSTGFELVEGTGSELPSQQWTEKKFFCCFFFTALSFAIVEGTGSELPVFTISTMEKKCFFVLFFTALSFATLSIMLSCELWWVLHANKRRETSNAAKNWCRQWTTTDLV